MSLFCFGDILSRIPFPSATNLKRVAVVSFSLAGIISILSTAIYLRRNLEEPNPLSPVDPGDDLENSDSDKSCDEKKRKKRFSPELKDGKSPRDAISRPGYLPNTSTANSSPTSAKIKRRVRRRRRRSLNNSFTSSSAASSFHSNRWRRSLLTTDSEMDQVESLYQEGVDSFEAALQKWEEATSILQTSNHSSDDRQADESFFLPSFLSDGAHNDNSSENHNGVVRSTSFSSSVGSYKKVQNNNYSQPEGHLDDLLLELEERSNSTSHTSPESQILIWLSSCLSSNSASSEQKSFPNLKPPSGLSGPKKSRESLLEKLHHFAQFELRRMAKENVNDNKDFSSFEKQLQSIVNHAQHIQDALGSVVYNHSDTGSDTDITLTGFDDDLSDADSESNASYVTAQEFWETRSQDSAPKRHFMLERALEAVERGEVSCRTYRSDLLKCSNDDEFLAKLQCVRQGFTVMLEDETVCDWLAESGRSMVECILCAAERNIDDFSDAFTRLIDFVKEPKNSAKIEEELKGRKVVQMTFYDVVLDFIIMDAFDDLAQPPGTLTAIMQNRWLAESLRESALSAAVWSVLKAKRSGLIYNDGFIAHLYDVSQHVTPVLAWGFLGPEGHLKDICIHFKSEVVSFLRSLFSLQKVRYSSNAQMADDILRLTRDKFDSLLHFLQDSAALDVSR